MEHSEFTLKIKDQSNIYQLFVWKRRVLWYMAYIRESYNNKFIVGTHKFYRKPKFIELLDNATGKGILLNH